MTEPSGEVKVALSNASSSPEVAEGREPSAVKFAGYSTVNHAPRKVLVWAVSVVVAASVIAQRAMRMRRGNRVVFILNRVLGGELLGGLDGVDDRVDILAEDNLVALGVVEDQREELVSADHKAHGHIDILFAELGVDAGLTQ